jgi:hypothetical protein
MEVAFVFRLYIVAPNGPVTAPGSQGVFRGKGVGSKWAPGNLLFLSWCLSCPVAGTSAQLLFVGGFKNKLVLS